ncbi:hypothetical protein Bbelb_148950 [Branchiostoma belcheri]|nr:hypothetical protein Bbelb_148950 [Branchiostoma belcheri]
MKGASKMPTTRTPSGRTAGSRPLGSTRHSQPPMFPPVAQYKLNSTRTPPYSPRSMPNGIYGIGMGLPADSSPQPSRPPTAKQEVRIEERIVYVEREKDNTREKELLEKEEKYKQKISKLEKLIEQLRTEIKQRQQDIDNLQQQLVSKAEEYQNELELERQAHTATRQELERVREELAQKEAAIQEIKTLHETEMARIEEQLQQKMTEMQETHKKELASRDEALRRLKEHMASALQDNSSERQRQLEELTKELKKMSEETEMLKSKLKGMIAKNKGHDCKNCAVLSEQIQKIQLQLRLKDKTIEEKEKGLLELKQLCIKFEKQLMQQDKLLQEWQVYSELSERVRKC